jgi:hypothetical protein
MELLEVCLRTTYFQVDQKFFQEKKGVTMGSSLPPIVSSIYTGHSEKLALDSAQQKPSLWLRYLDIFLVWPHGPERLQNFFSHPKSTRPSIWSSVEIESDSAIPFLDVLVVRKMTTLATKLTQQGRYLPTSPEDRNKSSFRNVIFSCF